MEKIISLFKRDYNGTRLVFDELVPGAEWVPACEGVATRKLDGTACLVRGGRLFRRYDAKKGKTPPLGFEPAEPEPDPVTGHWPGWLEVGNGNEDRWHREAFGKQQNPDAVDLPDGTYELLGPKVQGNPEGLEHHELWRHGAIKLPDAPRTFAALKDYFAHSNIEGIVWHHPDGRMVKIKGKDFGLRRPVKES